MTDEKQTRTGAYEDSLIINGSKAGPRKTDERKIEYIKEFQSPDELYQGLIRRVHKYHPSDDISMIDKAYRTACVAHMADVAFEVLHTPGHTKGGCCFYAAEDKILFCGDTIFNCSVGRTDFYSGSMRQLGDSIRERIMTLPDDVKLYSGHGDATTVGYERKNNPCLG